MAFASTHMLDVVRLVAPLPSCTVFWWRDVLKPKREFSSRTTDPSGQMMISSLRQFSSMRDWISAFVVASVYSRHSRPRVEMTWVNLSHAISLGRTHASPLLMAPTDIQRSSYIEVSFNLG